MAFKKGDVVRLKSGGPKMTVSEIRSDDTLFCRWFDNKNNPQQGEFNPEELETPPPPPPSHGPSVVNG